MATLVERHLRTIEAWLAAQPNFSVLYVPYQQWIEWPDGQLDRIIPFLDRDLDRAAMLEAVDPALYRNRR